jgi:hypothetical protein
MSMVAKDTKRRGKFRELDMGMIEVNSSGESNVTHWSNKKGTRRATSSSQKYADGWDRIFGKNK